MRALPRQAAQLSAAGEVFSEGEQPSESLSADSEIPCARALGRRSKVGEKSDSFSRAERTRPLRPVSRLQSHAFENVPVERFQRNSQHSHRVPRLASILKVCYTTTKNHCTALAAQWRCLIGCCRPLQSWSFGRSWCCPRRLPSYRPRHRRHPLPRRRHR